jgi:hypothetical protein
MDTYEYEAIKVFESGSGNSLVLFAAPAVEIDKWSGVPQKKEIGGQETTGFQRDFNPRRLDSLKSFYHNDRNLIQNPLLCAKRATGTKEMVAFVPDPSQEEKINGKATTIKGKVVIKAEPLENLTLLQLMKRVQDDLERRVEDLSGKQPSERIIRNLKQRAEILAPEATKETEGDDEEDEFDEENFSENGESSEGENAVEIMFSQESYIYDFWEEVASRVKVLEEMGNYNENMFLGYSKEAMISFIRPVVLVDGQHRLRGAIETMNDVMRKPEVRTQIEDAVAAGEDPGLVQKNLELLHSRVLPISLLMSTDPAEHVFQFVVVNQRATPIGRALLGTIVSTSLSNAELMRVSDRLSNAGIPLEESRAVAYLTRYPESPFYGFVEKGFDSDKDLLPWTVLVSLVKIFRDLKGGRLFHEKVDYADLWKRNYLEESDIVSEYHDADFEKAYGFWKQPEGVWRDVFIAFWTKVREKFASSNEEAWHYWGAPRKSNIFNKVYLTILASDFFAYLCGLKTGIKSIEEIPGLIDEWTKGVSVDYFNRDWKLEGVKKDTTGIRRQWAKLWSEYRKDPVRLPSVRLYRVSA